MQTSTPGFFEALLEDQPGWVVVVCLAMYIGFLVYRTERLQSGIKRYVDRIKSDIIDTLGSIETRIDQLIDKIDSVIVTKLNDILDALDSISCKMGD